MSDLTVYDDPTMCDECKREEPGLAFIVDDRNKFCLPCASDLNILDEDHVQHIKEFGENMGGKIEQAIQKTLNQAN